MNPERGAYVESDSYQGFSNPYWEGHGSRKRKKIRPSPAHLLTSPHVGVLVLQLVCLSLKHPTNLQGTSSVHGP